MTSPHGMSVELADLAVNDDSSRSDSIAPPPPPLTPSSRSQTTIQPNTTGRLQSPGAQAAMQTRSNTILPASLMVQQGRSNTILPPSTLSQPHSRSNTIAPPPPSTTPPPQQEYTTLTITLGATHGRRVQMSRRLGGDRNSSRRSQTVVTRPGQSLLPRNHSAMKGGRAAAGGRALTVVHDSGDGDEEEEEEVHPSPGAARSLATSFAAPPPAPPSYPATRAGTIAESQHPHPPAHSPPATRSNTHWSAPPSPPSRNKASFDEQSWGGHSRAASSHGYHSRQGSRGHAHGHSRSPSSHSRRTVLDPNPAIGFVDEHTGRWISPSMDQQDYMFPWNDDDNFIDFDPWPDETPEEREKRLAQQYLEQTGRYCLCVSRFVRLMIILVLLTCCAILLVVGANLVAILKVAEKEYLQNLLPISSRTMGKNEWQDFQIHRSSPENLYMWNVTNLYDVLTTGAQIHIEQIGPLSFEEITYRVGINESDSLTKGQIRFRKFAMYSVNMDDDLTSTLLDQPIVSFNMAYLQGMAQTARYSSLPPIPPVGFSMPQPTSLSDAEYTRMAIGGNILPRIKTSMLDPSSQMQLSIRTLSFPFYVSTIFTTIESTLSLSHDAVLLQWAQGVQFQSLDPSTLLGTQGFGLPPNVGLGALSNPTLQANKLFDGNNPNSLINGAWMKYQANNTFASTIQTSNSLTSADFELVETWMEALLAAGNTFYESAAISGLNTQGFSHVTWMTPSFTPTSFVELGALQFGTGLFSTVLTGTPVQLASGVATSMTAILGPLNGGLGGSKADEPMEFPLGAVAYADSIQGAAALLAGDVTLRLPIAASISLLDLFASESILSVAQMYSSVVSGLGTIVGNPLDTEMTPLARWSFLRSTVPPSIPSNALAVLTAVLSTDCSNAHALHEYLGTYLGNIFLGDSTLLDPSTGTTKQNGGLFTVQSIRDHAFGYTSKQGVFVPGILGPEYTEGMDVQSLIDSILADPTTKYNFVLDSGMVDLNGVGSYQLYRGFSQYQYGCAYHHSEGCTDGLSTLVNNYAIWSSPELIQGSSDGSRFPPFHEGSPHQTLYVFLEELQRVVPYQYVGDAEIAGLHSGHYILDPTLFNSSLIGFPYQNRWRNDGNYQTSVASSVPDGFINLSPLQGGVPIYASLPHMLNVDASEVNKIYGMNATSLLHDCSLYVEPLSGRQSRNTRRIQLNIRLSSGDFSWGTSPSIPDSSVTNTGMYAGFFAQQDHIYIPFYWREELSEISSDGASSFKRNTFDRRSAGRIGQWIMIIPASVGVVLLIGALSLWCKTPRLGPEWKPIGEHQLEQKDM